MQCNSIQFNSMQFNAIQFNAASCPSVSSYLSVLAFLFCLYVTGAGHTPRCRPRGCRVGSQWHCCCSVQVFKTAIAVFFPNETGPGAASDRKAASRAARAARRNNRTSVTSKVPSGPSFLENVDRVQKTTVQKTGSARGIISASSASSSRANSASLKDFLSAHASAPVEVSHNVRAVDDDEGGLPPIPANPDVSPLAAQPTVEAGVELAAATATTETKAEDCYITVNPPEPAAAPTPPTELPAMGSTDQDATFPVELEHKHRESVRLTARSPLTPHLPPNTTAMYVYFPAACISPSPVHVLPIFSTGVPTRPSQSGAGNLDGCRAREDEHRGKWRRNRGRNRGYHRYGAKLARHLHAWLCGVGRRTVGVQC